MKGQARSVLIPAVAAAVLLSASAAHAMSAYMRAGGVQGPVVRDGQPGWFKADNFSWGSLAKPAPGNRPPRSGSGAFTFTKLHDSASTGLMLKCATGAHIPEAKIQLRRGAGGEWQEYVVFQVKFTECPEEGVPGPETYSMDFGSIKWNFTGQKKDKKPDHWKSGN